jgi:L-fuculose-phosphate aldolase
MTDEQARLRLIDAGLILSDAGLGDLTRGHVSVRVPSDPQHFFMKPHSHGLDEITEENIVLCNLEGTKVAGNARRHSEVFIHSEIYKIRPDVMSVIHVHPPHAVAFSATGKALRPISQPAVAFADGLPVFDAAIDLIRSPELGAALAQSLGGHKAVLMRNHGAAIVGASLEEAVVLAIMLENACQIQLLAQGGGGIGETFSDERVSKLHRDITRPDQYQVNFDYLARTAHRARRAR